MMFDKRTFIAEEANDTCVVTQLNQQRTHKITHRLVLVAKKDIQSNEKITVYHPKGVYNGPPASKSTFVKTSGSSKRTRDDAGDDDEDDVPSKKPSKETSIKTSSKKSSSQQSQKQKNDALTVINHTGIGKNSHVFK